MDKQAAVEQQVWDQVGEQVGKQICDHVASLIEAQGLGIEEQVWDRAARQIGNQVWQAWDRVCEQAKEETNESTGSG